MSIYIVMVIYSNGFAGWQVHWAEEDRTGVLTDDSNEGRGRKVGLARVRGLPSDSLLLNAITVAAQGIAWIRRRIVTYSPVGVLSAVALTSTRGPLHER